MFDPIVIDYNGETKTIKPNEIMPLIAQVERIISLPRLMESVQEGEPPMAAMAMAYGKILRYAGFRVTDGDVYADMFSGEGAMSAATDATQAVLALMVPPNVLRGEPKKKAEKKTVVIDPDT
jgi:hypothetical protein